MRVVLNPIPGRHRTNIVKYKNCYDYLAPYYTRSGNIYTGLSFEDATRLGKLIGQNLLASSAYWNNFTVRIGADPVYLETEDPLDEIKYLFLKNHKRVKTSIFERKATADYLLTNKDEEAKRENMLNKSKVDAISEFRKMSLTDMRKCLRLFGQNADSAGSELVENSLFKIIEANPEMFLQKWINNKDREIEVVIEQAISKNVIRRNKNIYKYGSDVIGYSMQETIDFLNNPKNQNIKIGILSAIESKDYLPTGNESTLGGTEPVAIRKEILEEEPKKTKVKKPVLVGSGDDEGIDITKIDFTSPE